MFGCSCRSNGVRGVPGGSAEPAGRCGGVQWCPGGRGEPYDGREVQVSLVTSRYILPPPVKLQQTVQQKKRKKKGKGDEAPKQR